MPIKKIIAVFFLLVLSGCGNYIDSRFMDKEVRLVCIRSSDAQVILVCENAKHCNEECVK